MTPPLPTPGSDLGRRATGLGRRATGLGRRTSGLARSVGVAALVVAVLVGIQLGSIPWRYRRQIWQLQGFLLGGLLGYVVGRLSAAAPDSDQAAATSRNGIRQD
jgi:hypothetical protein